MPPDTPVTCLFYHPEAYTTRGPKLMGRNAAGESFLRGYLSHTCASEFWVQVQALEHAQHFAETVKQLGRTESVKVVDRANLAALSGADVVYYPGPGIGEQAFHRAAAAGTGTWSLCGITHTTASAGAMDAIVDLVTAPVQPWDAVICTSAAVKNNVERVLQAQVDYLQARLGLSKLVLPQLPVIPLGIHTDDFVFADEDKAASRALLGIDADTLVVLFMGRLSFHAKAHPLAMYKALETAAKASGKSVVLIECGWHANDFIARAYADAASLACPSVRVVTLDGRKAEDRNTAWAAADVFCSLADNIQETFGITPIEAMAAGLPVVVSDWDGYKDTVRDGVDGFRIATTMPAAGLGADLAYRHALDIDTYDMYCGHTSSLMAVDIAAAANAFAQLFNSPELRQHMGAAGRQRAVDTYDWRHIIARYEALWAQLTEIRLAQGQNLPAHAHPWPARLDPFHAFASYPTQILSPDTVLHRVDADVDTAMSRITAHQCLAMLNYAKLVLPTEEEMRLALTAAEATAAERVAQITEARRPYVFRSLTWHIKLGVLQQ